MTSPTRKLMDFIMLIGKLKTTKRTGWVTRCVHEPESVSDHMYRMSILAFLVDSNAGLNKDKCIKIALVHDMAECIVGDITPADNIPKEEKQKKEQAAMKHIQGLVSHEVGEEIYNLWQEYEGQSTPEAQFVKDLDKFEMIMQAYEYEVSDQRPKGLQEFFDSTKDKFNTPSVKEWVTELNKMRSGCTKNEENPEKK